MLMSTSFQATCHGTDNSAMVDALRAAMTAEQERR
jgi:hypothetical protein